MRPTLVGGTALHAVAVPMDLPAGHPGAIAPGPHVKLSGKPITPVGVSFVLSALVCVLACYPFLVTVWLLSLAFDRKRRTMVDWIVSWWAKTSLLVWGLCRPKVFGLENLPPKEEAVIFVPNHCSFLDIFAASGFIPRRFKYVSKIEILRIPLIGWAMQMADHVAIRRTDRRSQLQTFRDTVETLQNGNSVVVFAEGTRSKDGRLQQFKTGPFKMASKANVRVVPVSICGLHRWMPPSVLLPLGVPREVAIKIHPPVALGDRTEREMMNEVYGQVNAGLPEYQQAAKKD